MFGSLSPCYSTYETPTHQTGLLQMALCCSSFVQRFFKLELNFERVGSNSSSAVKSLYLRLTVRLELQLFLIGLRVSMSTLI